MSTQTYSISIFPINSEARHAALQAMGAIFKMQADLAIAAAVGHQLSPEERAIRVSQHSLGDSDTLLLDGRPVIVATTARTTEGNRETNIHTFFTP